MILENINKELRNKLQLKQWNNTTAVINWCKKIENKNKCKFMIFDIKDFYSSISKKLLDDSINFARQHIQIKREDFSIIQHARKSLLYNKEIPWQKKNTNLFDVAMGAYDGAEVCELVGLFLLNSLANKFDKTVLDYTETTYLPYSKISMVIMQIKYVKTSTNYLRQIDYL